MFFDLTLGFEAMMGSKVKGSDTDLDVSARVGIEVECGVGRNQHPTDVAVVIHTERAAALEGQKRNCTRHGRSGAAFSGAILSNFVGYQSISPQPSMLDKRTSMRCSILLLGK